MENILEHYESESDSDRSTLNKTLDSKDDGKELQRMNSGDSDFDEKDEQLAKAIESNLFDDLNSAETSKTEDNSRNDDDKEQQSIELSFDEDFMFPEPRRDVEKEQKERDRQKRKELKTKKEMEEEEREKMQ